MPASVAIIICTRDRAESLRETLAAIGECTVPPDLAAELIVVDNGSTDATAAVVRAAHLPNLPVRCVAEPQPGLVHARNAGLRAADADVLLCTDDDVRPAAGWIEGMCRPLLARTADAVAGTVRFPPHYEALFAREPFLSRRGWFAGTDDFDVAAPGRVVGANMAFNRRVVETLGEFDPELGSGALGFFEDTVWSWRIREAGLRVVTAGPEASVEHHFDRSRLTRATLMSMAERMGRSTAWVSYHWEQDQTRVTARQVWKARMALGLLRVVTPWRRWQTLASSGELRRVETQAYLETLRSLAGQPRKYHPVVAR